MSCRFGVVWVLGLVGAIAALPTPGLPFFSFSSTLDTGTWPTSVQSPLAGFWPRIVVQDHTNETSAYYGIGQADGSCPSERAPHTPTTACLSSDLTLSYDRGVSWQYEQKGDLAFARVGAAAVFLSPPPNATAAACLRIPAVCLIGGFAIEANGRETSLAAVTCNAGWHNAGYKQHAPLPEPRAFAATTYHAASRTLFVGGGLLLPVGSGIELLFAVRDDVTCAIGGWKAWPAPPLTRLLAPVLVILSVTSPRAQTPGGDTNSSSTNSIANSTTTSTSGSGVVNGGPPGEYLHYGGGFTSCNFDEGSNGGSSIDVGGACISQHDVVYMPMWNSSISNAEGAASSVTWTVMVRPPPLNATDSCCDSVSRNDNLCNSSSGVRALALVQVPHRTGKRPAPTTLKRAFTRPPIFLLTHAHHCTGSGLGLYVLSDGGEGWERVTTVSAATLAPSLPPPLADDVMASLDADSNVRLVSSFSTGGRRLAGVPVLCPTLHTGCPTGSMYGGCDSGPKKPICSHCAPCEDGQFTVRDCYTDANGVFYARVCSACSVCPTGTLTANQCGEEGDAVCVPSLDCPPNSFQRAKSVVGGCVSRGNDTASTDGASSTNATSASTTSTASAGASGVVWSCAACTNCSVLGMGPGGGCEGLADSVCFGADARPFAPQNYILPSLPPLSATPPPSPSHTNSSTNNNNNNNYSSTNSNGSNSNNTGVSGPTHLLSPPLLQYLAIQTVGAALAVSLATCKLLMGGSTPRAADVGYSHAGGDATGGHASGEAGGGVSGGGPGAVDGPYTASGVRGQGRQRSGACHALHTTLSILLTVSTVGSTLSWVSAVIVNSVAASGFAWPRFVAGAAIFLQLAAFFLPRAVEWVRGSDRVNPIPLPPSPPPSPPLQIPVQIPLRAPVQHQAAGTASVGGYPQPQLLHPGTSADTTTVATGHATAKLLAPTLTNTAIFALVLGDVVPHVLGAVLWGAIPADDFPAFALWAGAATAAVKHAWNGLYRRAKAPTRHGGWCVCFWTGGGCCYQSTGADTAEASLWWFAGTTTIRRPITSTGTTVGCPIVPVGSSLSASAREVVDANTDTSTAMRHTPPAARVASDSLMTVLVGVAVRSSVLGDGNGALPFERVVLHERAVVGRGDNSGHAGRSGSRPQAGSHAWTSMGSSRSTSSSSNCDSSSSADTEDGAWSGGSGSDGGGVLGPRPHRGSSIFGVVLHDLTRTAVTHTPLAYGTSGPSMPLQAPGERYATLSGSVMYGPLARHTLRGNGAGVPLVHHAHSGSASAQLVHPTHAPLSTSNCARLVSGWPTSDEWRGSVPPVVHSAAADPLEHPHMHAHAHADANTQQHEPDDPTNG